VAAGCPGSLPTANLTCLSTARLGQVMQVQVNNLPQSAAVYALGFSNTISSAGTLPLDLTRYGMPGCHLLVSVDSAQMLTVSGSTAVYSLPIPSVSGLLGLVFYQQALVPDPAAGNPAGAVMSDAAAAVIGT
jgi:hypothetical protein